MTKDELKNLKVASITARQIKVDDLINKSDRTLVYGYDCERFTYHLYLKNEKFYSLWQSIDNEIFFGRSLIGVKEMEIYACSPDKRVYPESCDFEFATLLRHRGVELPYTHFDEKRAKKLEGNPFHGYVHNEE